MEFINKQEESYISSENADSEISNVGDRELEIPNTYKSKLVSAEQLLKMPNTEPDYLWKPFIQRQDLGIFSGGSDLGKSSFLRELSLSICSGKSDFLGMELKPIHKRVIYLSTEDGEDKTERILKRQLHYNYAPEDYAGLLFLFDPTNQLEIIKNELKLNPVDLVICDAFLDMFDGKINDAPSARNYMNKLNRLSAHFNCAFILLHHTGKRTEALPASKNNLIGSQGFEAKARFVLELRLHGDRQRELWVTKGNYIPDSYKRQAMILDFDEHQTFKYTGELRGSAAVQGKIRKFSNKDAITLRLIELREKDKLSYQKAHLKLQEEFRKVPSESTLKIWYKQATGKNDNGEGSD